MRIAAAFDKRPRRAGALRLAQQYTMRAAAKNLAELPRVEADIRLVGAIDRRLDDDGRRAMTGACRSAIDQPLEILSEAGHVERAMFHADINIISPGP